MVIHNSECRKEISEQTTCPNCGFVICANQNKSKLKGLKLAGKMFLTIGSILSIVIGALICFAWIIINIINNSSLRDTTVLLTLYRPLLLILGIIIFVIRSKTNNAMSIIIFGLVLFIYLIMLIFAELNAFYIVLGFLCSIPIIIGGIIYSVAMIKDTMTP